MEPLKPEEKEEILARSLAEPRDLERYEQLLAERFTRQPGLAGAPARAGEDVHERELHRLHEKLFGRPSGTFLTHKS